MDEFFGFGIEATSGFVENEDGGIVDNGAGDLKTLFLAAREFDATLADLSIEATFQLHNKIVGVGLF